MPTTNMQDSFGLVTYNIYWDAACTTSVYESVYIDHNPGDCVTWREDDEDWSLYCNG